MANHFDMSSIRCGLLNLLHAYDAVVGLLAAWFSSLRCQASSLWSPKADPVSGRLSAQREVS